MTLQGLFDAASQHKGNEKDTEVPDPYSSETCLVATEIDVTSEAEAYGPKS